MNTKHVRECLQETLKDMYGATMVTISEDQQQLFITIDEKKVSVDLESFVSLIILIFLPSFDLKMLFFLHRKSRVMMKRFSQ